MIIVLKICSNCNLTRSFRLCNYLLNRPYYFLYQYAKLAISLTVPGGGKKKKAAAATSENGGANSGADKPEEDEDEYAGGLC